MEFGFLVLFSGRFRELLNVDAALNLKTRTVLCYFVIVSVDVELTWCAAVAMLAAAYVACCWSFLFFFCRRFKLTVYYACFVSQSFVVSAVLRDRDATTTQGGGEEKQSLRIGYGQATIPMR